MTPIEYFKEFKYVVVRNFISEDVIPLYYEYCITQVKSIDYKITYCKKKHNEEWDGHFNDTQSPGNFSKYGDFLMESSLNLLTKKAEDYTGIKLNPNYAYWRLYEKGSVLERHKDRPSCEISATINLGSNLSNVDKNVYPNYQWPIFVLDKNNSEIPIHLNPGDALIYRGCEVEHWRDEFIGLNNAQVFFHWNEKNGQFNIKYDGRPFLGLPKNK
jgi:hypothetical protein